jgi:hypothetical protein
MSEITRREGGSCLIFGLRFSVLSDVALDFGWISKLYVWR